MRKWQVGGQGKEGSRKPRPPGWVIILVTENLFSARPPGTLSQPGWPLLQNPSRSCSIPGCISNQYRSVAAWFRSPPGLCSWQYLKRTWKPTPFGTSLPLGCSRMPRGPHRFELQAIDPLENFSIIFDYSRVRAVEWHVICVDCVR